MKTKIMTVYNWCVHLGPFFYLEQATNIGELKERLRKGETQLHHCKLGQSRIEISDKYVSFHHGHSLVKFEEDNEAREHLLPDSHTPISDGQIVYVVVDPVVDMEAHGNTFHGKAKTQA